MSNDKVSIPQYSAAKDIRRGPLRIYRAGRFSLLEIGPFQLWISLYVHPSERTDAAAFEIESSVKVRVMWGDTEIYKATVLRETQKWGLCVRMGDEWKKAS